MKQCYQCGANVPDNAQFCTSCGASMAAQTPPEPETAVVTCPQCGNPVDASAQFCTSCGNAMVFAPPAPAKKKSNVPVILAIAAAALLLLGAAAYFLISTGILDFSGVTDVFTGKNSEQVEQSLEEAKNYMQKEQFDKAIKAYLQVLEADDSNKQARLDLAQCYLHEGNMKSASKYLKDLKISANDALYAQYQTLQEFVDFNPACSDSSTESFPQMVQELQCDSAPALKKEDVSVAENGAACSVTDLQISGGKVLVYYTAEDSDVAGEQRDVTVTFRKNDVVFPCTCSYVTPQMQEAALRLVSTDVSEYPVVKAYFRVEDAVTGEVIESLDVHSFVIRESVQGGQYLEREVRSVVTLDGHEGINIDLAADKSDSISDYDMDRIQNVMIEFVNKLHFAEGDRAEVLAFDSIVQQMCGYTGDKALLINGIRSMSTDGMTALYDALYIGTNHALLQGGARCVVAFTDGLDNSSSHSAYDVIDYAVANQVPIFIIGVGSNVDTYTLQDIAEETGGRYWYINDLYDLGDILEEIYVGEKKMYAVEYVSDASLDAYSSRSIDVTCSGRGYRTKKTISFDPPKPPEKIEHTSRYEVFKDALTWEEASQKCQEMGGHLVTITSAAEEQQMISLAEANGLDFIWLGGYTSYDNYDNVFGHWVTGEQFNYSNWSIDEPSRVDHDGTEEWYIMLWNIPRLGGWTWNDQRNDPVSAVKNMAGKMGYICEFEEY